MLERLGFEVVSEPKRRVGLVLAEGTPLPTIASLPDTGPAGRSGLAPGDVLVKVNGFPFSTKALSWTIAHEPRVSLEVQRGQRFRTFDVQPVEVLQIGQLVWRGTSEQLSRLRDWLGRQDVAFALGEALDLTCYENFHGVQTVL